MRFQNIAPDVVLGQDVRIYEFVNLYGCQIGDGSQIGAFVEIQKNARVGRNVKISSHSFICEGVTIEDEVFIGHGVCFINDRYPRATTPEGKKKTEADWHLEPTVVRRGASIGSGATILCGLTIGEYSMVGAGSTVLGDVPPHCVVAGNPARLIRGPQGERPGPAIDRGGPGSPPLRIGGPQGEPPAPVFDHGIPPNPYNPHAWIVGHPTIGEGTWIGAFCVIDGSGGLTIGKGCDIACGAHILSHSTVRRCLTQRRYPVIDKSPTVIEDYCFIGENATVLKGCTIGHHSVVGAGAVVTEGTVIPPYSLAVGVPARVVRHLREEIEEWARLR